MSRHVRGRHAAQEHGVQSGQGWELTCPEAGSRVGASWAGAGRLDPPPGGQCPAWHEGGFTPSHCTLASVGHQRVKGQRAGS